MKSIIGLLVFKCFILLWIFYYIFNNAFYLLTHLFHLSIIDLCRIPKSFIKIDFILYNILYFILNISVITRSLSSIWSIVVHTIIYQSSSLTLTNISFFIFFPFFFFLYLYYSIEWMNEPISKWMSEWTGKNADGDMFVQFTDSSSHALISSMSRLLHHYEDNI